MKHISRLFLFGALALMLLSAACAGQQASPTPTVQPTTTTVPETPTVAVSPTTTTTATPDTTLTPGIPVTALTVSLVCQFCIDNFAHALVTMPAAASFTLLTPTASVSAGTTGIPSCNTVETVNDKQVVLCRGQGNTSITLNVCSGNNCQQFAVRLQTCPPLPVNTATMTPTVTNISTSTPTPLTVSTATPTPATSPTSPPSTPTVSGPTSTPTLTLTPTFTTTPASAP